MFTSYSQLLPYGSCPSTAELARVACQAPETTDCYDKGSLEPGSRPQSLPKEERACSPPVLAETVFRLIAVPAARPET